MKKNKLFPSVVVGRGLANLGRGRVLRVTTPPLTHKSYDLNLQGSLPYFLIIGVGLVGGGVVGAWFWENAGLVMGELSALREWLLLILGSGTVF